MKETGILFTRPLVDAILEGRKTQTRRIINPAPDGRLFPRDGFWIEGALSPEHRIFRCPYGGPGDRLWVKTGYYKDAPNTRSGRRYIAGRFMPRHLSPLTLENLIVRAERLHDITEADAIAEGIERCTSNIDAVRGHLVKGSMEVDRYARLWDSINGPNAWAANPWVWVIEFKRL